MDKTEIDLSKFTVQEACFWLLASLKTYKFEKYAYTAPFSSYVMTWWRAVPINAILILQSPYPNDIFTPIAAAMSYSTELCQKHMKGRDIPPTVQVLANDLYINAGMKREDSIAILKNGWALVDKGILLVNEAVFGQYSPEDAYLESIKQCSVLIRLLQETEKHGKRTVDIFAFGESGERVGSNLCSWYKSPTVKLSKRKVTHPAGIARRFSDLNDPDCHMGTSSFSKALVKVLSNHVAFMHNMAKKSEQDLKQERLQNTFATLHQHFPVLEQSILEFTTLQKQLEEMTNDQKYKEVLEKVAKAGDSLASRLRIATSIVNNVQSYGSSAAGNVSRSGPSMKTDRPSESFLSEHAGRESDISSAIPDNTPFVLKGKKRNVSTPVKTSSFSNISSPPTVPSISSAVSEAPTPLPSNPAFRLKAKTIRSATLPKDTKQEEPSKNTETKNIEEEKADVLSPLGKKFSKKAFVPKSSTSTTNISKESSDDVFSITKLTDKQIKTLSSIQGIVEMHKPGASDDEDCVEHFDNIQNDIVNKTAYNFITQNLVKAISEDINTIPNFDINQWLSKTEDTCKTFEVCKQEFEF